MVKIAKLPEAQRDAENGKTPRFVLVFGPDRGICRKHIDFFANCLKSTHPQLDIRFFGEDDVSKEFDRLEESITGSSLFGGASIAKTNVRTDTQAAKIITLVNSYAEKGNIEGALMINGNGLAANSKLVSAFEKAQNAWCIRTYDPTIADFNNIIKDKARQEDVRIGNDAITYLLEISVQDSEILINEIENLALYVGKGNEITIDKINDLSVGGREGKIDEVLNTALLGQGKNAILKLHQAFRANVNEIQILNSLIRRLRLLISLRQEVDMGGNSELIVKDRKYGIFWKDQENFRKQIALWSIPALESVFSKAVETDIALKQTNYPVLETLEKLFISIAEFVSRKRR